MGGNTLVRLSQNKEETNIMIILIRILHQPLYSIQTQHAVRKSVVNFAIKIIINETL
jgi:hypothetical protein